MLFVSFCFLFGKKFVIVWLVYVGFSFGYDDVVNFIIVMKVLVSWVSEEKSVFDGYGVYIVVVVFRWFVYLI